MWSLLIGRVGRAQSRPLQGEGPELTTLGLSEMNSAVGSPDGPEKALGSIEDKVAGLIEDGIDD